MTAGTGERSEDAELHRLHGELLQTRDAASGAAKPRCSVASGRARRGARVGLAPPSASGGSGGTADGGTRPSSARGSRGAIRRRARDAGSPRRRRWSPRSLTRRNRGLHGSDPGRRRAGLSAAHGWWAWLRGDARKHHIPGGKARASPSAARGRPRTTCRRAGFRFSGFSTCPIRCGASPSMGSRTACSATWSRSARADRARTGERNQRRALTGVSYRSRVRVRGDSRCFLSGHFGALDRALRRPPAAPRVEL
jgi:hypothetical protein